MIAWAVAWLLFPTVARAQADSPADSGDTALVLGAALLALAMILPGIVLHHGARLRARAMTDLAVQAGAIVAVVSLIWVVVGYTLAFGTVGNGWLGSGNAWMLIDLGNVRGISAVPESAFVVFELGFAVLAALLLNGGWAQRGNLAWIVPFAGLWSLIVYAPLAHWIWGGGWLATRLGTVDNAGALVVHASAGMSALVITLLIGRRARFDADEPAIAGPAPGLALAGTGLVWGALLAMTAAATLAASDDAATAVVAVQVAAATGALVWLMIDGVTGAKAPALGLARGAMAGLVTASGAAGAMAPGMALLTGAIGAVICWAGVRLLRHAQIDDAVDVVAIHGVGGVVAALLVAPLIAGTLGGTGYAPSMNPVRQVVAQALGAGVVIAWSVIGTAIAALMVAMVVPMRIPEADERADDGPLPGA